MSLSPEEVSEALEHIYDAPALATSRLARQLGQGATEEDLSARAQAVRRVLLDAIERLQPPRGASFRDTGARGYEVLALRFIEGMPPARIAEELHISRRQTYRDLEHAIDGLTALLNSAAPAASAGVADGEALLNELDRFSRREPERVDLDSVLKVALETVASLARQGSSPLVVDIPADLPPVFASEALLKQMLVEALSVALRSAGDSEVRLRVVPAANMVELQLEWYCSQVEVALTKLAAVRSIAEAQRLQWEARAEAGSRLRLNLRLPGRGAHTVLVIEDNQGAIELYRRYLSESGEWQVIAAPDPRLSVDMARQLRPSVIVLDVLMPRQDGWSVLRLLRAQPETAETPILVCSVFDEADLAAALGATGYLMKPLSQSQLLVALRHCL